ncbi:MAG: FecR domain-containing protein [Chitinophagaceae bacterium]|nr:FecR domain-containing protein [Chitinophagaceae bacterium]
MTNSRLKQLLDLYFRDQISPEGLRELQQLISHEHGAPDMDDFLQNAYSDPRWAVSEDYNKEQVYQELLVKLTDIKENTPPTLPLTSSRRRWTVYQRMVAAASVVILVLATGVYFLLRPEKQSPQVAHSRITEDVHAPQTTKAIITLADGRVVTVDSLTTLSQHTVALTKTPDGKIVYTGNTQQVAYNTLTNPKGSPVIDITLSDGSRVWLNAGSAVTYPVAFSGHDRKISINGEAYLEVAHDKSHPFYVAKNNVQVQVLGTHFNVNAYDDESNIKVTLLEGAVAVSYDRQQQSPSNPTGGAVILKPGQQARIVNTMQIDQQAQGGITVVDADIEKVIAWKNGLFNFDGASLYEAMRQIERWYDIDVVYEKGVQNKEFVGELTKGVTLTQLLEGLEEFGMHYRLEGKTLTLLP